MAVTLKEQFASVSSDGKRCNVGFLIAGATSFAEAWSTVANDATITSFNGLPRQDWRITEINENKGDWRVDVRYSFDAADRQAIATGTNPNTADSIDVYSWDVSVRSKLERFRSDGPANVWSTVGSIAVGDNPEGGSFIAVDRDGLGYSGRELGFQGIETLRPEASFALEFKPSASVANNTYRQNVSASVGKVNSFVFNGYAAGEVLFAGVRGQARSDESYRLSCQFLVKKNRTNIACGNGITIAAAEGWDTIEVEYKRVCVEDAGPPVTKWCTPIARQARVLRSMERADLASVLFPSSPP